MDSIMKNISTTVAVLGMAFSMAGNSSIVVSGDYALPNYGLYENSINGETGSDITKKVDNIYIDSRKTRLELLAETSFGVMRDATEDELEAIDKYIESVSKTTGINFFSVC